MTAPACARCAKSVPISARGLCKKCYQHAHYHDELANYDRQQRTVAETIEELHHQGFDERLPIGPQIRNLAPRLGMTFEAVERALQRHRKRTAA